MRVTLVRLRESKLLCSTNRTYTSVNSHAVRVTPTASLQPRQAAHRLASIGESLVFVCVFGASVAPRLSGMPGSQPELSSVGMEVRSHEAFALIMNHGCSARLLGLRAMASLNDRERACRSGRQSAPRKRPR